MAQQRSPLFESGSGSKEPIRETRAAVLALRNSSQLDPNCHYVVIDPSANGNLQLQEVLLHAVDERTLSGCYLKTAHDNTAWVGSYDIDTNRVEHVYDHLRRNDITGNVSVVSFPFGNGNAYNNTIKHSPITYTSGTFYNNNIDNAQQVVVSGNNFTWNTIGNASNVNVTGGNMYVTTVENDSDLRISGGTSENNTIKGDSSVTIEGGNFRHSLVDNQSFVTIRGGNNDDNTVKNNSSLTVNGGNWRLSTIENDSNVTINSQDNYRNTVGYANINQVGTGRINQSEFRSGSSVTNGNTQIWNSTFANATDFNSTGSGGAIRESNFSDAYLRNLQNIGNVTFDNVSIFNDAQVNANGVARVFIQNSSLDSRAYFRVRNATTDLDVRYCDFHSNAHIRCDAGRLYCWYTSADSNSDIFHRSTATNNRVERCKFSSEGFVEFRDTSADCRLYRSHVTNSANVYFYQNSSNARVDYLTLTDNSQVYIQNSAGTRISQCRLSGRSQLNAQNSTGLQRFYYCTADAFGYLQILNSTADMWFQRVNVNSQSIARIQNSNVNGRIQYSRFDAYYYLLATYTTTANRSGLFGQGRITKSVTNPTLTAPYNQGNGFHNIA